MFLYILLACLALTCLSCSHVRMTTPGGVDVIGRTMELGGAGGELFGSATSSLPDQAPPYRVTVHARGESYSHSLCKSSEAFEVHYGFVSVDQQYQRFFDNVTVDGMNEHGLTISGHTLRQSVYQGESSNITLPGEKLCFLSLIPWALAKFRLVKELTQALQNISVVADTIAPLPPGNRLHWAVEDASGEHVVLEYLKGQLHIHENRVGVMTNDPDYTWHLRNLNNYAMVRGSEEEPRDIEVDTAEVGVVPSIVGHGFNLWGLPGDLSPPSRFVRLFYKKALVVSNRGLPSTVGEGVTNIMGLLNDVWITKGAVALGKADGRSHFEFTQYSLIKVPQKRLFHWRSYDNPQWQLIDLSHIDFGQHSSTPVDDGSNGIVNVTGKFITASAGNTIFT